MASARLPRLRLACATVCRSGLRRSHDADAAAAALRRAACRRVNSCRSSMAPPAAEHAQRARCDRIPGPAVATAVPCPATMPPAPPGAAAHMALALRPIDRREEIASRSALRSGRDHRPGRLRAGAGLRNVADDQPGHPQRRQGQRRSSPRFRPKNGSEKSTRRRKTIMKQALQEMINTKLLVAELRSCRRQEGDSTKTKRRSATTSTATTSSNCRTNTRRQQHHRSGKQAPRLGRFDRIAAGTCSSNKIWPAAGCSQAVQGEKKEPTHDEMLAYYKKHGADWDTPARARWEQLTAKWDEFQLAARKPIAALARWGDDVLVRRVPFAEVAKAHSQDYAADEGGVHDWVNQGQSAVARRSTRPCLLCRSAR